MDSCVGWIRVKLDWPNFTIKDYAYQTSENEAIKIGSKNTVGVVSKVNQSIKSFSPKITKGVLTLNISVNGNYKIEMFSISGQLLQQFKSRYLSSGEKRLELNRSVRKNGLFLVKIRHNSEVSVSKILVN